MKIGLVGEAPNDTNAIRNLLSQRYFSYDYTPMLQNINGSQLDSQKTKRQLRTEYEKENPEVVIFIRDLDGTKKTTLLWKPEDTTSGLPTVS